MPKKTILVVDDELKMIKLIGTNLKTRGYAVLIARDGKEALEKAETAPPDLVVLDLLMPELDGRDVCRSLREWTDVPILIVSALCQVRDKVACLELGADDYLTKPFAIEELMARIESLLRRAKKPQRNELPCINIGNIEINLSQRIVKICNRPVNFTATEYRLLQIMAQNTGKVLTHQSLLSHAWGPQYRQESEYLRVYISRIRKKLASCGANENYIKTIPGIGYQFG